MQTMNISLFLFSCLSFPPFLLDFSCHFLFSQVFSPILANPTRLRISIWRVLYVSYHGVWAKPQPKLNLMYFNSRIYVFVPFPMTLDDLEGHSPNAGLFKFFKICTKHQILLLKYIKFSFGWGFVQTRW